MDPKETGHKAPQKIHSLISVSKSAAILSPLLVLVTCKHLNQSRTQSDTKHFAIHFLPSAEQQNFWMIFPISVINNHAS